MTKSLLRLGWIMACVGLGFHTLTAVYFKGDWRSWLAIVYFLVLSVASSMLKSSYGRYRERSGPYNRV